CRLLAFPSPDHSDHPTLLIFHIICRNMPSHNLASEEVRLRRRTMRRIFSPAAAEGFAARYPLARSASINKVVILSRSPALARRVSSLFGAPTVLVLPVSSPGFAVRAIS